MRLANCRADYNLPDQSLARACVVRVDLNPTSRGGCGRYTIGAVSVFEDLSAIGPQQIWDGVLGRVVHGEQLTMGVVELDPGGVVPLHSHENEQLGVVVSGSLTFQIGDETRELGPGGTYRIAGGTPHELEVGPDGAVVVDIFAPVREDWKTLERQEPGRPRWPE
jgi:quercetin dioxygenase-like cupin family protein